MSLTEEERKEAFQDFIDNYVGYEIDWDNPPGPAAIALEQMQKEYDNAGVRSESIDDLSQSFTEDISGHVKTALQSIRKLKW